MKDWLIILVIILYILPPNTLDPSHHRVHKICYPYPIMNTNKYIYFLDEPGGNIRKEEIIMRDEIYNNMVIGIFDMYGIVDIRNPKSNRNAQIHHCDDKWEVHLYWFGQQQINKYHKTRYAGDKEAAVTIGKEWVTGR